MQKYVEMNKLKWLTLELHLSAKRIMATMNQGWIIHISFKNNVLTSKVTEPTVRCRNDTYILKQKKQAKAAFIYLKAPITMKIRKTACSFASIYYNYS